MSTDLLAGVDVGGSKIAVLVTDGNLAVCARQAVETGVGGPDEAIDRIEAVLDATLATAGLDRAGLVAVGVGVPGRVDPEAGSVTLAVNLGWHDLPLGPLLAERFGLPIRIENDVRAAAAGLHERRVLGDGGDLAYLSIGTGISAEIGHVVIDADGPACPCGLRGCFEAIASGPAVARRAEAALDGGAASSLAASRPVTAVDVYRAAAAGDPLALELAESTGRHIARAVHELVMAYDVRRVVLGGGVTNAGEVFLAPILRGLDGLRNASELAREVLPPDIVHLLPAGSDAGAWGAVVLARSAAADGPGRRWSHESA
jgi:glucokinase